jgi:predicted nuclease of predicted toxin-antitoxin system
LRFLIDACLPRELAPMLDQAGHQALDVRDIGLGAAPDGEIAAHAKVNRLGILTEDWGFGDIRVYPPQAYPGIVIFQTVDQSIDEKLSALRNLLSHDDVVARLEGRLAIVTPRKIRLRPPL